jgi:hypothetical protein
MKIVLLCTFFLISAVHANEQESLDKYYNDIYLGEQRTLNYYGPINPRTVYSDADGKIVFIDEVFQNKYLNSSLQNDIFDIHNFWNSKIIEKSTCPDEELGANIEYIRYMFRLVSLSYLFESMKNNHRISSELGFSKNSCNLNYQEMFGKCSPHSDDMKKFKERIFGKFVNEYEKIKYNSLSKKETESWLELFHLSTKQNSDPTFVRLQSWCDENQKNCKNVDLQEVKSAIVNFCDQDKKLIKNICDEKDDLRGLSYAKLAEELVKTSNAFNLINSKGMGEDCLRRYIKLNASKEIFYSNLSTIFPAIYKNLQIEKTTYLQGSLFLPGALKEFDMKGLSDFLIALKPPKVIVAKIQKPKPKPKPVIVKKVEPQKVEPVVEPPPVVVVEEVPVPRVKEFDRALEIIRQKKADHVALNMELFREDYEFTSKMISQLSQPLKKFQTRQALTDMKNFDKLGTEEAPVGIVFIKFLIDTDNHQGLYNVINVLGDKFFINNDFEGKMESIYAELKNDASTNNHWQITFMKKPEIKK